MLKKLVVPAALLAVAGCQSEVDQVSVDDLVQQTHIHGISVNAKDPSQLHLATHHGFYVASKSGMARQVSEARDDFMGFTPHPTEPDMLYASGHPQGGGNLGFLVSTDGGRTWSQRAAGVDGPVDFHQMDVSKADPDVIYGVHRGLQASSDAGYTWEMRARVPDGLIDLAASAERTDRLYAATRGGLLLSSNGGRSWRSAHPAQAPASMVETTADGHVYAFIVGVGLVKAREGEFDWQVLSDGWGEHYLLHLAVDTSDPDRLYAVGDQGNVLASSDGGGSWTVLTSRQ